MIGLVTRTQEFHLGAEDAQGFSFALLHYNDVLAHGALPENDWYRAFTMILFCRP
jgi:methyl coenzyme M reductase beta subunit